MKKILLFIAVCVVLAACQKENVVNDGSFFTKGQQVTISARSDASIAGGSKASGSHEGININYRWEDGDVVLLTILNEDEEVQGTSIFKLSNIKENGEGEFTGTIPADGGYFTMQYPATTPDLSEQNYAGSGVVPKDEMLFVSELRAAGSSANLKQQYSMLGLNLIGTKTLSKIVVNLKKGATLDKTYTLNTGDITLSSSSVTEFIIVVDQATGTGAKLTVDLYDSPTNKFGTIKSQKGVVFDIPYCTSMPTVNVDTLH